MIQRLLDLIVISLAPRCRMIILEIGFDPLLRDAYPDEVIWIDTALRWDDVRSYQKKRGSLLARIIHLWGQTSKALSLAVSQPYSVVVARCLSTANTLGQGWAVRFSRSVLRWIFEMLILFAARGAKVKLVIVDATDRITIHPRDRRLFARCNLYFKRELAQNLWHSLESILPQGACPGAMSATVQGAQMIDKLRPFSLGITADKIRTAKPMNTRRWDIFYSGTEAHVPARKVLPKVLAELEQHGWKICLPKERLSYADYMDTLSESRFCCSPSGIGWDCHRHYECLSQGAIPLLDHRAIMQSHTLRDARECFYLDYQTDLAAQMERILRIDSAELGGIAKMGQEVLREHLTFQATAKKMYAMIQSLDPALDYPNHSVATT